jgi:tetratricopeptide (TPR) repeat protein
LLSEDNAGLIVSVYLDQGKFERALEEERKLGISPSGTLLLLKGDFDEAEEKFREMLESEEAADRFNGRQNLSFLYKAQGKFTAAEDELKKALEIGEQYNQNEWVWYALSDSIYLKLALGKPKDAFEEWEKYEGYFPELYTAWLINFKVQILEMMKNFEEADKTARIFKENLDAWIEQMGTHKHIRYWYFIQGLIALERDKIQESILHLKDAVLLLVAGDNITEHARFMETLARAYYRSGDLDKAREEYERITNLTRGRQSRGDIYARSFYMLGKIHEQQGKKSKAKKNYEKFLDLWKDADPGLPEVEDARKRLAGLK